VCRVGLLESAALMRGELLVRLNIDTRPIANKHREGKLQRTLEREFKGRETDWKETDGAVLMSQEFRLDRWCYVSIRESICT